MTLAIDRFETFALVLLRITGLFLAAPFFGSRDFPAIAKIGLGGLTALLVLPAVPAAALPVEPSGFALFVAAELAVGLTLGLATTMFFSAFQLAGQHVGQQMGLSMADVVDPFSDTEVTVVGQFQLFLALILWTSAGGHRGLLGAVAESFQAVPLGGFRVTRELVDLMVGAFGSLLTLSFQIAAPALGALFLSTAALGFVARAVPQMNVLLLSFPIQIGLGLGVMLWTLPAAAGWSIEAFGRLALDLRLLLGAMVAHGG